MKTSDYTYDLPQEKIAIYPLARRDASKLLIYKKGAITHSTFISLDHYLPENAFLFFNNTKVIPARLHFRKDTGAEIEIFLLHPILPSSIPAEAMIARSRCRWQCAVGNLKRWTSGTVLKTMINETALEATLTDRSGRIVDFSWNDGTTFAEVLRNAGEMPLPPYINRRAEHLDSERYQTIYSSLEGAVAAPTAGLHFTEDVFRKLKEKNIGHDFLTLHVSAGTFQPVKAENPDQHLMHEEQVIVNRANLDNLRRPGMLVTAVGTTSMRTLESLYWFGSKLLQDPQSEFNISQTDADTLPQPPPDEALAAVADYLERSRLQDLVGETSIFIRPGYKFKVCKALITNFHQPASTLIMLVAAFVGEDWRKIYEEALKKNYRFLSYGDSSLLIP
ncbi:MAG TPA: S-adenosylmethionine:tRNA ribosyltransferase-isomerase [Chryseosolibacter sp.]